MMGRKEYKTFSIRLLNLLTSFSYYNLSKYEKDELKKNRKYKNIYSGKRCFIVGCGPSLNSQDLALLENEYVFTVNQFMRSPIYSNVKSNFHVMADWLYFNLDTENPDHKVVIDRIRSINTDDNKPLCFFPVKAKSFVKSIPEFEDLNISYFYSYSETYDGMKKEINLTRTIPGFNTVTQYAICIAIYMGFSEIYLLGCDMTGYKEVEQFATNTFSEQTHAYAESAEDMKKALHKNRTCEEWFTGFAKMFVDYRRLYEFADSMGIKIYNATAGGVLDSIPRKNYEELF
ncbi:MAG: DUF115 domain-containing protein [Oscillospiraceae bacterium]|nr:DUF115 domain-containing protein [Oscillospiraceae bacterium]